MTRYAADSRDRVREAVDMLALVTARTELRRAGASEWVGLCPFHEERTPSFGVNPYDKVYHCFGCQASGDAFTFVMETEGLDFTGALETLANRFGVQLETEAEDPQAAARRQRRERLQLLLGRAADYYARYLWESAEAERARRYLFGRGLEEAILREFRVGYAPSAWDRMLTGSRRAGFSDEELLAAGLAQRSHTAPGRIFDRFRERIMFPTADARGRVIGFGARAMRENQPPKYLNSAEGELYHKRQVLYGIDLARAAASRAARVVLVEGYTDVLALHQAGMQNTVGIMGTSLTEEQVAELERLVGSAGVLELALDADRAGQDAMMRGAQLADRRKLKLRVVQLPEGQDPASLIQQEGADRLRQLVKASVPFVEFHVERILSRVENGSAEEKDQAIAELAPALKLDAYAGSLRAELPQRISNRLGLSEKRLAALVDAALSDASRVEGHGADSGYGRRQRSTPAELADPAVRTERYFLVLCIALPDAGRRALQAIDPEQHLTSNRLRRAARHLAGQTEMPLSGLAPEDEELAGVMADLVARAGRAGTVSAEQLEQQRLLLERARLERAIRRAREEGAPRIGELAREREQVLGEIRAIDSRMEKAV